MTDTPRDWADEIAHAIYDLHKWDDSGIEMPAAIAAALRVQPGHVRDDKGVERKVLGELPVTADGVIVGRTVESLWTIYCGDVLEARGSSASWSIYDDGDFIAVTLSNCYSTRTAAEAARDAKGGG